MTKSEKTKQWRKDNPEKAKKQRDRYNIKHHELRIEQKKKYHADHLIEENFKSKEWYFKNLEKSKIASRKFKLKKFGITLQDYEDLLTFQASGCTICGKTITENGRLFAIDHDHKTGKVRGLLCSTCNVALGLMKDNPELLNKAIKYLSK